MGINELEFQWRLNWWYRPTQCDGFGSSVTDYYECFCDWKNSMAINSCPAVESDYVDAFIQNLRCDIRSRLESKGRPRIRRLSDAFYDAKLEECLISMEEVFKKFEEKFEARNMFDKMPSQNSADSQEFLVSSHSFSLPVSPADSSNESAENLSYVAVIEAEEFLGLKDAESSCLEEAPSITEVLPVHIESEKETHKMFDKLTETILEEGPSIDQVLGNIGDYLAITDGTITEKVEGADKVLELDKDDYDSTTADEISIQKAGDVYKDELVLTQGLKQFSVKLCPIYPVEKVLDSAELGMVKAAYQVVNEMPRLFSVEPKVKISEDVEHIPSIDCVPRVFDPGTSIIDGDLGAADKLNMHLLSFCMNNELPLPIFIGTSGYKLLEKTSDVDSWLNSQKESTLNLDKPIKSVVTGLKPFPNGNDNCTLLIECVLQVFDPGIDVIGRLSTNGLKFEGRTNWLVLASLEGYECFADCSKKPNQNNDLDYDLGTGSAIVVMRKTNYMISKMSEKKNSEIPWIHAFFAAFGGQDRRCVRIEDQLDVLVVSFIFLAANLDAKVELHSVLGMYTKEVEVLVHKTIAILLFPLIKSCNGHFKEDTLNSLHIIPMYWQVHDTFVDVLGEGFSTAKLIIQSDMSLEDYIFIINMDDRVWDPGIHSNCCQNIFRRVGFVISNEMHQGQCMVEKSRIYTIGVDRHIRVGDLSLKYEGVTVLDTFLWAVGQAYRLRNIISIIKAGGFFRWLHECCYHFGYDIECNFL